jgi:hypothetical protein
MTALGIVNADCYEWNFLQIPNTRRPFPFSEERSVAFYAASWIRVEAGAFLQASTDARISDCLQRGLLGPI